jgi:hypothetical protein
MLGRQLLKMLGLSMLATVAVMAVGASAAQAKWLIKVGGVSVSSANFVADVVLSSELLVAGLGFQIRCDGGKAAAKVTIVGGGTGLTGSGQVEFTGCVIEESEEVCTINSPGRPAGAIVAAGSGSGQMEGKKIFTELSSANFTEIQISGEECALAELDAVVSGSGTGTLVEPETEKTTHLIEVDEKTLFYGKEPVSMHGAGEQESGVEVIAEEVSGKPWAIQLVGL